MEKKWCPCWCLVLFGILTIVFAWVSVSWGAIALTVIGIVVAIRGITGKCCCDSFKKKEDDSCCH